MAVKLLLVLVGWEGGFPDSFETSTVGLCVVATRSQGHTMPKGTLPPSEPHTDPRLLLGQVFGCWLGLHLAVAGMVNFLSLGEIQGKGLLGAAASLLDQLGSGTGSKACGV